PESVAVVFEDRRWSYRELNQRANQLARYLRKRGIGPDRLVGVCMDRSPEMVVAVLAVLKAGGAYVPLDARSPAERLRFLLDDTRASVLLTRQACGEVLRRPSGQGSILDSQCATICLDRDRVAVEKESGANLEGNVAADNLAYVIYTSGSTGRPKGVLIEHQQIVNYLYGIKERFALAAGASYAMAQPLTVDASHTTLWPPLIFGGVLHLVSEERALDGQGLADYMSRFEIDLLKLAPSHLVALQLSSPSPARLLPRRWLIIGGEEAKPAWATKLRAMARCAIFNHYGPTEATVGMLTYSITEGPNFSLAFTVPLGRPLPNSTAYVLGRQCELVPVGVTGELYIGGSCLARGYLNRADFTAEKFIPDPFDGAPGARLYRTGDLARYLPDGNIEFLGRTDDQVKIRGFRIELGEIEAALAEHPSVGQSAALVGEDEVNEKRLLCYVVPQQEAMPVPDELRGFLRKKLPEHMVPSAFILLNGLPRTPHGKLDRNALPAFDENLARPDDKYATPRTPIETSLSEIWSEILRVERIGIHDNFFDLGGHSLMAIRLISRIRDTFKLDLPLRDIFETPTVSGIAQRLQEIADRKETPSEPKIGRVERQQYLLPGKK
ncbi:MAG TPA: amino acid adenylation domain-containing protein, partial [Candidatus Binatia bacterium]